MPNADLQIILATDCGSTTTKAILIEKQAESYRLVCRGEAPTTVEAPAEDVTRGVLNALGELEDLTGRRFVRDDAVWMPRDGKNGCDAYVGTSSAGGGLQMMVAGVVRNMSTASAERAALGAGAVVIDTLAVNDGRQPHERIERIRAVRPDMVLIAGGTDGGTVRHVAQMCDVIAAADPRPRFGGGFRLPVIYAGNTDARAEVERTLGEKAVLTIAENLRPHLEVENTQAARDRIHDLFLEHVMAQAPGYGRLLSWTSVPLMPTPGAVGLLMQLIARRFGIQVLGVDIGGATTDVFSVARSTDDREGEPVFHRTVSANLGMSYSISNVVAEAGFEQIARWVPVALDEADIRDRIRNKMIRPTTIPQTLNDLLIEHAVCREALRLALGQHKAMAVGLRGVQQQRTMADTFTQQRTGTELIDMLRIDMLVGAGGILSHAPRRAQAALLLIDACEPEGFTELTVDSIFMMPQLGVLSTLHEQAALDVFERDCLVRLGWCIAPRSLRRARPGMPCMQIRVSQAGAETSVELKVGALRRLRLATDQEATVSVQPARGFDIGAGPGRAVTRVLHGGEVGLVLDARGRPLLLAEQPLERRKQIAAWLTVMDAYPQASV